MKIVKKNKKTSIILENGDTLEITMPEGNHVKMNIKCLGNTLHIEENTISEEEKAILAMQDYLKKHQNEENNRKSSKSA